MPTFTVKVPNDDEGEDLGEYESDYLPRVGDAFALWHPRVCKDEYTPFLGIVQSVSFDAYCGDRGSAGARKVGSVNATVWLVEDGAPPQRYCDCSPEMRRPLEDGTCDDCRGTIVTAG
jgi:hypothetical protein